MDKKPCCDFMENRQLENQYWLSFLRNSFLCLISISVAQIQFILFLPLSTITSVGNNVFTNISLGFFKHSYYIIRYVYPTVRLWQMDWYNVNFYFKLPLIIDVIILFYAWITYLQRNFCKKCFLDVGYNQGKTH